MPNKYFKFVMKKIIDECPNLAPKKSSFLSFDEIVKKTDRSNKKYKNKSFIEANEQIESQNSEEVNNKYTAFNTAYHNA